MNCRVNILIICFLCHIIAVSASSIGQLVNVSFYGACPNDTIDDTRALREAVKFVCTHPGSTLYFPKGTYILKDEKAIELEKDVLDGKYGKNPEKEIYTPYFSYVKGLDFTGAENVTFDAEQVTLLCEGWMEPISLNDCKKVRVKGITIDYKRKPFVSGDVINITKDYFDVQFGCEKIVTDQMPLTRMTFWDKSKNKVYPEPIYYPKRELLGKNRVRFHHSIPMELLGSNATALNSLHFRPAVLIYRSDSVILEDVTIHAQAGMGVVGFDSKNVFIKRLAVTPSKGYFVSTNTDATHFACCEGVLHFQGCYFQGQGDDATNVHGYYQSIVQSKGKKAELLVKAGTYTHAQVADVPRVGDEMELVEIKTLKPVRTYKVMEVKHRIPEVSVHVTLSDTLPQNSSAYYLMNVSKLPKLIFENSMINSHLARGILVKTRNAMIRNNVFRNCTGTAIHIGAEANWHEGTHAKNVVVMNNVMVGCGKGAGSQAGAAGISVIIEAQDTENTYLHEQIRLENNLIAGEGNPCGIYVGNAKGVIMKNNKIISCEKDYDFHSVIDVNLK